MPIFGEHTQYINFHNTTDLPLNICAWVKNSNTLQSARIGPFEKLILHSSVGEWHIDSMFSNEDDRSAWKNAGLEKYLNVGKFRSDPCASGNYSWMEYYEPFDCIYTETSDKVKGLITFVKH